MLELWSKLTFYLTYFWTCFRQPDPNILFELLSNIAISSDIPDIFLTILSDTFFLTFLQTYLLTFYLTYLVTSWNYFFDHSFCNYYQSFPSQVRSGTPHWTRIIAVEVRYATLNSQNRSWGPAHSTEHTRSQLGSGTPHWTRRIAVGVRYATLHSQDRGWSPARHTELTGSQLRSDMPHWTHRLATGQGDGRRRGGEGGEGGRGRGGGEETDIKSNNPHLTGGEQPQPQPQQQQQQQIQVILGDDSSPTPLKKQNNKKWDEGDPFKLSKHRLRFFQHWPHPNGSVPSCWDRDWNDSWAVPEGAPHLLWSSLFDCHLFRTQV